MFLAGAKALLHSSVSRQVLIKDTLNTCTLSVIIMKDESCIRPIYTLILFEAFIEVMECISRFVYSYKQTQA